MAVDWRYLLMAELILLAWLSWRWIRLKAPRSGR